MKILGAMAIALALTAISLDMGYAQDEKKDAGKDRTEDGGRRGRGGRGRARGDDGERGGRGGRERGGFGRGGMRPPQNPLIIALDVNKDGEISKEELENAVAALKTLDKNNDGKLSREELRPPRESGREGRAGGRGDFMARIMANDKNKDGKVTKDEVPEDQWRFYERMDTNKDGEIVKEELEAVRERFGRGFRGGRGRGGDDDRPSRPNRPESDDE